MGELKKILYVEDEPDIRAVAELALNTVAGFEVCLCDSGSDALKQIPVFQPDLIVMDVIMPGMDGPETFKALRGEPETRKIPVVFMTAKVQATEVESYRAMGVAAVIPKPFDPMTLGDQIREIWASLQ